MGEDGADEGVGVEIKVKHGSVDGDACYVFVWCELAQAMRRL